MNKVLNQPVEKDIDPITSDNKARYAERLERASKGPSWEYDPTSKQNA